MYNFRFMFSFCFILLVLFFFSISNIIEPFVPAFASELGSDASSVSSSSDTAAVSTNTGLAGMFSSEGFKAMTPFILIIMIFYFMMIRPQQKKIKEHRNMISSLKKGDEVVSSGGIVGKIAKVEDDLVYLEIAQNISIKIKKDMIAYSKKFDEGKVSSAQGKSDVKSLGKGDKGSEKGVEKETAKNEG